MQVKKFAVIGYPISHSLSPMIHQHFAKNTGISLIYEKIEVTPEIGESFIQNFFAQGGCGLNITAPLKTLAYEVATKKTTRAKAARSANTLWFENGQICADNTDGIGLLTDLLRQFSLKNKHILILGAGGAVRGIMNNLLEETQNIAVYNRTAHRVQELKKDFPHIQLKIEDHYDFILNAIPSNSESEELYTNLPHMRLNPFCYDLCYSVTACTPFTQWAKRQGYASCDGFGMLVEQAAKAFEIWHGVIPNTRALHGRRET